jgi:hypothetical protein
MRFNSTSIPSSCPSNFKAAFAQLPLNPVSPRIDFATTSCNRSRIHLRVTDAGAVCAAMKSGDFLLHMRGLTALAFVTSFLATPSSSPFVLRLSKDNGLTDLPFMVRQAHHVRQQTSTHHSAYTFNGLHRTPVWGR